MKISRRSWHYKIQSICGFYPSTNLCQHFWKTVVSILIMPFVGILVVWILMITILFVNPIELIAGRFTKWNDDKSRSLSPQQILLILLKGYSIDSLKSGVFSFNYNKTTRIWFMSRENGRAEIVEQAKMFNPSDIHSAPSKSGLVSTYLKAKKEKICPLIEWSE